LENEVLVRKKTQKKEKGKDVKTLLNKMDQDKQRNILFRNFEGSIGCHHILKMDYDLDKTFTEDCYFQEEYLCTIAHNADDKCTELPDTKSYDVKVTWPDGRIEKWKLSFFVYKNGPKKGQFEEFPEGQKFMFQFMYKEIIGYAKS
jgi:hypothetical protein